MSTLTAEISAIMADVAGWSGESLVGRRYLAQSGAPPRVVWVPMRGAPQPAMKVAGATRSIATRRLTLALSVWQTTPDTLSDTIDAIMAAVHRRWYGRWQYGGEDWTDEAAQTDLGEQATLTLSVDLAVLDSAAITAITANLTTTQFNTTPAVEGDGVMHAGEQE